MVEDSLGVENINQLLESILSPLSKEDTNKAVIEKNISKTSSLETVAYDTAKWILTQESGEVTTEQIQLLGVLLDYLRDRR